MCIEGVFASAFGTRDVVLDPANPLPRSTTRAAFQEVSRHLGFLRTTGTDGLHALVSAFGTGVSRVAVAAATVFVTGDDTDVVRGAAPRDDRHLARRTVWTRHALPPFLFKGYQKLRF